MHDETRWKAKWTDRSGAPRAHTFDGPPSRAVARIDFQLECIAAGEQIPEHFDLEEATVVLPALSNAKPDRRVRGDILHRPRRC